MTKKSRLQCRAFIALAVAGFIAAGCATGTDSRTLVYNDVTIDGESGYRIELVESRDYLLYASLKPDDRESTKAYKDPDYGPMTIIAPDGTETVLQNDHPDFSKIFALLELPGDDFGFEWHERKQIWTYTLDTPVNIHFAASPVISPD